MGAVIKAKGEISECDLFFGVDFFLFGLAVSGNTGAENFRQWTLGETLSFKSCVVNLNGRCTFSTQAHFDKGIELALISRP